MDEQLKQTVIETVGNLFKHANETNDVDDKVSLVHAALIVIRSG